MADYNNIEDIIAGVENATQLVTETQYNDGTYTLKGVDWFSYNGIVCNNIYANGDSWIGLGAYSEHLKVNRIDGAMWNLWREEGTYLNNYKFLRIRWSGYSRFLYPINECLITYDVILFDTGDMMLYMVDIPTINYTGTFMLGSLSFTKPTTDNRYVTFYLQEDGTYSIEYAPISITPSYITRYLVRDNGIIYTVIEGVLVEVTGELTSQLFIDNGTDRIPSGELLMTLSNPEVLCWTDSDKVPTLSATVKGIPEPQTIQSADYDMTHSTILGIEKVIVDATDGVLFAVSFDEGATWKIWTGTAWGVLSEQESGMSAEVINGITSEQWNEVAITGKYRFRVALSNKEDKFKSLVVDYIN